MSVYTVCAEFVRECCSDEYYAFNVLFEFIKDNDKRISVDRQERNVLREYGSICREKRARHMVVWLKQLASNQNRNIELISIKSLTEKDLYVDLARCSPEPRKLIVWSKDHYKEYERTHDILFLDREAAKREMSNRGDQRSTYSEERSMKNVTITAGAGTNIIIGSKLQDSMNHLTTNISPEAAGTLKSMADCVEASGSQEAGKVFDKLSEEISSPKKSDAKIMNYVNKLFEYLPDMVKIGKSAQETVEILTGS